MEIPLYTAMTAGVLLVLQQLLMFSAGMHRAKTGQGVGVGDDLQLERKVRRHGNLAENAAVYLVTLGALETVVGSTAVVLTFAAAFLVARVLHAIGFSHLAGSHAPEHGSRMFMVSRAGGAGLTGMLGIALGLYLLYRLITL